MFRVNFIFPGPGWQSRARSGGVGKGRLCGGDWVRACREVGWATLVMELGYVEIEAGSCGDVG